MITTVTTATTNLSGMHLATLAGIIGIVGLIIFLIAKELIGSTNASNTVEGSGWGVKAKILTSRVNIAIYSLLVVFAAIVATQVLAILRS